MEEIVEEDKTKENVNEEWKTKFSQLSALHTVCFCLEKNYSFFYQIGMHYAYHRSEYVIRNYKWYSGSKVMFGKCLQNMIANFFGLCFLNMLAKFHKNWMNRLTEFSHVIHNYN